ncbi:MAG: response regulator, partial [Candidatus Saccharibacteria bacterium]
MTSTRVLAYHRWDKGGPGDDVIVVLNFSNRDITDYAVGFPRDGVWQVRFNSAWKGYSPDFKENHLSQVVAEHGQWHAKLGALFGAHLVSRLAAGPWPGQLLLESTAVCFTMIYMDQPKKIVIIEDNAGLADIYKTRLEMIGYTCFIGYNGITGLYFTQKEIPDLVLLDLMIPDIPGGKVLETMRETDWGKGIKVLIISNLNETEAPGNLRQLGIEGYVVKANMTDDKIDQLVNGIFNPAQPV